MGSAELSSVDRSTLKQLYFMNSWASGDWTTINTVLTPRYNTRPLLEIVHQFMSELFCFIMYSKMHREQVSQCTNSNQRQEGWIPCSTVHRWTKLVSCSTDCIKWHLECIPPPRPICGQIITKKPVQICRIRIFIWRCIELFSLIHTTHKITSIYFHQDTHIIPWENDKKFENALSYRIKFRTSGPTPKVKGVYSGSRPILHPGFVEIS